MRYVPNVAAMNPAVSTALAGFAMGAGLIIAIGAQNIFVLRQGISRSHVGAVVAICALSDALLIAAGVTGMGTLIARVPELVTIARILGAAFLGWYGLLAARRALSPGSLDVTQGGRNSLRTTVLTCLAFTWLNPHVYLDTVVFLGSVAATHAQHWAFGVGAMLASLVWFSCLGFGARLLRPVFARPRAWQVLDVIIAVVMLSMAVSLVRGI